MRFVSKICVVHLLHSKNVSMRQLSFLFLLFLLQSSLFVKAQVKIWTLDECIAHAIKENINVKQSSLDVATASIDKKGAIGNFLPTLNANASHSWNIGLNQDLTTGLLTNQTTQFTSAGANVGIDIYKGLQNQNNLRKANLSILAAKYQLLKMQEDIALNVANAYLQVLFAKENLKVQEEQLNISKKQQNRTQELVKAGSIPRGDLLDVNATVATNMQNVVVAQNNLLVSKLSVTQLLQLTEVDNFDVSPIATELVSQEVLNQNPETILKKAKETRTELKIANTNLEIAQKDLAIVKGALQPSFSAFYNFNTRVSYADIPKFNTQTNTIVGTQNANPFFQQFDRNKGQS